VHAFSIYIHLETCQSEMKIISNLFVKYLIHTFLRFLILFQYFDQFIFATIMATLYDVPMHLLFCICQLIKACLYNKKMEEEKSVKSLTHMWELQDIQTSASLELYASWSSWYKKEIVENQSANTVEPVFSCFKKSKRSVRAKAGKTKEVVRRRSHVMVLLI